MKFTRGYIIAFTLALLPILAWLGSDSVRQDTPAECERCGSAGHFSKRITCVWGHRWEKKSGAEIQPSLFLQDFPEFRCEHSWDYQPSNTTRVWGGPLFKAAPLGRGPTVIGCGPYSSFAVELYHHDAAFREKLKDALEDELVTRAQLVRWFEYRWSAETEPFELADGEADAFAKLNAIADKVSGGTRFFAPLSAGVPPHSAPSKPF